MYLFLENETMNTTEIQLPAILLDTNLSINESGNGSGDDHDYNNLSYVYQDRVDYIRFIVFAIILFSGVICNILAIVCILTSKVLRNATTGHYLIALTSADLIYITGYIFVYRLNFLKKNKKCLTQF